MAETKLGEHGSSVCLYILDSLALLYGLAREVKTIYRVVTQPKIGPEGSPSRRILEYTWVFDGARALSIPPSYFVPVTRPSPKVIVFDLRSWHSVMMLFA